MSMDIWEEGRRRPARQKPHRRAQNACHRCRAKKTKCDNRRPSCGFCIDNHAQCIYGELDREQQIHEPTMRELFDRINHVAHLLESNRQPPGDGSVTAVSQSLNSSLSPSETERRTILPAGLSPSHVGQVSTPAGISFESTLKWPIFQDLTPPRVSSLVMQKNLSLDDSNPRTHIADNTFGNGLNATGVAVGEPTTPLVLMDQTRIRRLSQRYLTVAHVKNPIFEVSKFNMHFKRVMENGLDWSEDSCVVMLACALASTVKQVRESFDISDTSLDSPHYAQYESADTRCSLGDAYFLAAKKRLGLLDVTLTSVQCFFLAGLYEICRMKPANAWVHYSQACSRLQIILSQENPGDEGQSPDFHILERLYFSCCRTELDLREELHLAPSGITDLAFPHEFPRLPSWISFRSNPNQIMSPNATPDREVLPLNVGQQQEEQSWYYYLASIALRKEANSIIDLLYRPGEHVWTNNIEHMVSQAALQEHELDQWQTLLPDTLKFDANDGAPEDLAFILECRQLHWRQISYRPLLYYALHRPDTDPYFHHVLPLAQKCLHYCTLTIKRLLRPYYYEATWFIQRNIATATLLVLAAQIRGPPLYVPNWKVLVSSSLRALAIQKVNAPDLGRAQLILERILDKVSQSRE